MTQPFGNSSDSTEINSDEKLLALFSHLSLFFGGILLPFIFWLTNKDKSKFVTFHSLQALWFHIAYVAIIIIFIILIIVGGLGISLIASGSGGKEMPVVMIIALIAFYALLFLYIFGGMAYSVYMALKSYKGIYNKYPVIGNIIYKKVSGSNG